MSGTHHGIFPLIDDVDYCFDGFIEWGDEKELQTPHNNDAVPKDSVA